MAFYPIYRLMASNWLRDMKIFWNISKNRYVNWHWMKEWLLLTLLLLCLVQDFGAVPEDEDFLAAAYIQYLYKHLYPCYQYILWGDPANGDASRILYAKRAPFPFNFTHPAKYTKHTEDLLEIFGNFSINDKLENHNTTEVTIAAIQIIAFDFESNSKLQVFSHSVINQCQSLHQYGGGEIRRWQLAVQR